MSAWDGLTPPYATIVVDPPWDHSDGSPPWSDSGRSRRHALPYSVMSVSEIARLPVADLAASGAHLYLWTTNRFLEAAFAVVRGWGFAPTTSLVWCKDPVGIGMGGRYAITTEYVVYGRCIFGPSRDVERAGSLIRAARETAGLGRAELHRRVRGGKPTGIVFRWEENACLPTADDWEQLQEALPALRGIARPEVEPPPEAPRFASTWFQWKRGPHSTKPPAFLDLVEQVSPAPRVELFARAQRLGWDSWGRGYEYVV